jgi:hypothetical protein
MKCKCFAALVVKKFNLGDAKGREATLPWNKGEQVTTLRFYFSAI